ncbi:MAG: BlaI/MecI/CopY family transcriptional regulator [Planctomycetaceae bacterium]
MARPKAEHPTPAELEILKILWDRGPCTVRDVHDVLKSRKQKRAYTSVMSLMNVMADKGQLKRKPQGRAYLYQPAMERETTLGGMVGELCERVFEGSASLLVTRLLEQSTPTSQELEQIREAIETYRKQHPGER